MKRITIIIYLLQDLTLWHAVCDWMDLIPAPTVADLMALNFFPRWLQVILYSLF